MVLHNLGDSLERCSRVRFTLELNYSAYLLMHCFFIHFINTYLIMEAPSWSPGEATEAAGCRLRLPEIPCSVGSLPREAKPGGPWRAGGSIHTGLSVPKDFLRRDGSLLRRSCNAHTVDQCPSPSPWQSQIYLLFLWFCLFCTFHIDGIIQNVVFVTAFFHWA